MRNKILGTIGVVWGGAVLISAIVQGGPHGSGAYATGQMIGFAIGALMLVAGGYTLVNSFKK